MAPLGKFDEHWEVQFLVVRVADAVNVAGESVLGSGRESPKVARASVSGSTAARSRSK
jgi:hypothetical protein